MPRPRAIGRRRDLLGREALNQQQHGGKEEWSLVNVECSRRIRPQWAAGLGGDAMAVSQTGGALAAGETSRNGSRSSEVPQPQLLAGRWGRLLAGIHALGIITHTVVSIGAPA